MTDPLQTRAGPAPGFAGITVASAVEDVRWTEAGLGDLDTLVLSCARAIALRLPLAENVRTEIGVTFTGDAEVKLLNAEWRGKDTATNVLSFPMADLEPGDAPGDMLGDLVFALETLQREAAFEGKPLEDHLRHLVVHGLLHCLGFDHVEVEDAEDMEAFEIEILGDLGVADPYAHSEPEAPAAIRRAG